MLAAAGVLVVAGLGPDPLAACAEAAASGLVATAALGVLGL
jgi:hypothetical protein